MSMRRRAVFLANVQPGLCLVFVPAFVLFENRSDRFLDSRSVRSCPANQLSRFSQTGAKSRPRQLPFNRVAIIGAQFFQDRFNSVES